MGNSESEQSKAATAKQREQFERKFGKESDYPGLLAMSWRLKFEGWCAALDSAGVRELVEALRAIVVDANNRNEPGQTWDMVAGGLIDSAEEAIVNFEGTTCDASTRPAQKDTLNGITGPSENSRPTSKSDVQTADSGQSGLRSLCELCGEPMPEGEEMFKYHGYSGPCPDKALARAKEGL